jgi:hypothetical protein
MAPVAQLRVTHPSHLELVDWLIHDQFFAADDVGFDEARGLVTIPFEFEDVAREEIVEQTRLRKRRARVPLLRSFLRRSFTTAGNSTLSRGTRRFRSSR